MLHVHIYSIAKRSDPIKLYIELLPVLCLLVLLQAMLILVLLQMIFELLKIIHPTEISGPIEHKAYLRCMTFTYVLLNSY